jgi:hypothetical protein
MIGFELYMDDGALGPFVKTDASEIDNKSYLREHTVTFDASSSGLTFRYKLKSLNQIGETVSVINSQILAEVP